MHMQTRRGCCAWGRAHALHGHAPGRNIRPARRLAPVALCVGDPSTHTMTLPKSCRKTKNRRPTGTQPTHPQDRRRARQPSFAFLTPTNDAQAGPLLAGWSLYVCMYACKTLAPDPVLQGFRDVFFQAPRGDARGRMSEKGQARTRMVLAGVHDNRSCIFWRENTSHTSHKHKKKGSPGPPARTPCRPSVVCTP
jgi:hypothetical protein